MLKFSKTLFLFRRITNLPDKWFLRNGKKSYDEGGCKEFKGLKGIKEEGVRQVI